jgi:hypothetical protein
MWSVAVDQRKPFQQVCFVMNLSCSTYVYHKRAFCLSDGLTLLWFEALHNNIWHTDFTHSHLSPMEGAFQQRFYSANWRIPYSLHHDYGIIAFLWEDLVNWPHSIGFIADLMAVTTRSDGSYIQYLKLKFAFWLPTRKERLCVLQWNTHTYSKCILWYFEYFIGSHNKYKTMI